MEQLANPGSLGKWLLKQCASMVCNSAVMSECGRVTASPGSVPPELDSMSINGPIDDKQSVDLDAAVQCVRYIYIYVNYILLHMYYIQLYVVADVFQLVADNRGHADHDRLTVLLRNCIQIPKQLGEVAAFGGSNVEPSIQSCMEKVGCTGFVLGMCGNQILVRFRFF